MMIIDFGFSAKVLFFIESPSKEADELYYELQDELATHSVMLDNIKRICEALEEEAHLESIVRLCHTGR